MISIKYVFLGHELIEMLRVIKNTNKEISLCAYTCKSYQEYVVYNRFEIVNISSYKKGT